MRKPVLILNALNRSISYAQITKNISDTFWSEEIVPLLYPLWETEKNKIETFVKYDDESFYVSKNKFVRNHKTKEFHWKSYVLDIESFTTKELNDLYDGLRQKYLDFKDIEDKKIEEILASEYAKNGQITWAKLLLIRNFLLQDSDWTQTIDNKMSNEDRKQWKTYRQRLRDITKTYKGLPPEAVLFPITPKKYKKLETEEGYLENKFEHFYKIDGKNINHLCERIVHYLALAISVGTLDESDLNTLQKPEYHINEPIKDVLNLDDYINYVAFDEWPELSLDALIEHELENDED